MIGRAARAARMRSREDQGEAGGPRMNRQAQGGAAGRRRRYPQPAPRDRPRRSTGFLRAFPRRNYGLGVGRAELRPDSVVQHVVAVARKLGLIAYASAWTVSDTPGCEPVRWHLGPGASVLRQRADGAASAARRRGRRAASGTAADGYGGGVPQATQQCGQPGAPRVPLPAARPSAPSRYTEPNEEHQRLLHLTHILA